MKGLDLSIKCLLLNIGALIGTALELVNILSHSLALKLPLV